jgi:environmental stress-induced protein Ves
VTRQFNVSTLAPTPWKNGGGTTREIACFPDGATVEKFEWRVSVANVNADGAFSKFDGVDRTIVLLSGKGMWLNDHALMQVGHPYAFPGETDVFARLIDGPTVDFNVMVRRGAWRAEARTRDEAFEFTHGERTVQLVYFIRGAFRSTDRADDVMLPGHGLIWEPAAAAGDPMRSIPTRWQPTTADALALTVTLERV